MRRLSHNATVASHARQAPVQTHQHDETVKQVAICADVVICADGMCLGLKTVILDIDVNRRQSESQDIGSRVFVNVMLVWDCRPMSPECSMSMVLHSTVIC